MKTRICITLFFYCMSYCLIAQTALQTSFESGQGYNVGALNNQNGWTVGNGTATVNTAVFKTGSQSVKLAATASALKVDHTAYSGSVPGLTGEVYVDVWIYPVAIQTKNFAINGYDLYGSSQKRIFVIEFTTDNKIRAFNGSSSSSSNVGTWVANQWTRISLKVDFVTEKYQVALNGSLYATQLSFRETYTPTLSGTRPANVKEYHALRFNHLTDTDIATSEIFVDDIYVGKTPLADVSFGASSTERTVTVNQPSYGNIALNPSKAVYQLNDSVTATLTLPQGYKNYGWTGSLSGTSLVQGFTVNSNMIIGANTGVDSLNPPPSFTVNVNQPLNGTISLSPASPGNIYYKETVVTATIAYEPCFLFNSWTGDLTGNQMSKSFSVQNDMTIGATIIPNNIPAVKRTVSSVTDFKNALAAMNPGDTIEVNDGSYNLSSYTINRSGCEEKPIIITAKNKNQVVLNGSTALLIKNAKYIVIKGFVFQSANIGTGIKLENCSKIRITENKFNYTENASCTWVYIGDTYASTDSLKSGYNRIDHNIFDGKTQAGNFIRLDGNISQQTRYDTIDHNHFKNNGPRAVNEKESIRIGVSTLSKSSGFTIVEYNLFEDCDGDPEIVSVKSRDNIIRYNTFRRSLGTLCVRQSFRTVVEGNYFFGEGKTALFNGDTIGCGGIRVYGKDHVIINNYFEGLTGKKWDAAITITNGDVTNASNSTTEHNIPENVVVAFNTLYNNRSNIEIGFDNNGNYSLEPVNCNISNNIIEDTSNAIVKYYSGDALNGVSFFNNIFYPSKNAAVGFNANVAQVKVADPMLIKPACVDLNSSNCINTLPYRVYRLSSVSPAIDAATGVYNNVVYDFEKQQRTGLKDIGAHEYKGNSLVYMGPLSEEHVGPDAIPFVYSYGYGALPVTLISFTAQFQQNAVVIEWNVAEQSGIKNYEVEWSTNGSDFTKVFTITAGTSSYYKTLHYQYEKGLNYYRLKIKDADGSVTYSSVKNVRVMQKSAFRIYPNPATNFFIAETDVLNSPVSIKVMTVTGVTVKTHSEIRSQRVYIDVSQLPSGMYLVQMIPVSGQISSYQLSIIK